MGSVERAVAGCPFANLNGVAKNSPCFTAECQSSVDFPTSATGHPSKACSGQIKTHCDALFNSDGYGPEVKVEDQASCGFGDISVASVTRTQETTVNFPAIVNQTRYGARFAVTQIQITSERTATLKHAKSGEGGRPSLQVGDILSLSGVPSPDLVLNELVFVVTVQVNDRNFEASLSGQGINMSTIIFADNSTTLNLNANAGAVLTAEKTTARVGQFERLFGASQTGAFLGPETLFPTCAESSRVDSVEITEDVVGTCAFEYNYDKLPVVNGQHCAGIVARFVHIDGTTAAGQFNLDEIVVRTPGYQNGRWSHASEEKIIISKGWITSSNGINQSEWDVRNCFDGKSCTRCNSSGFDSGWSAVFELEQESCVGSVTLENHRGEQPHPYTPGSESFFAFGGETPSVDAWKNIQGAKISLRKTAMGQNQGSPPWVDQLSGVSNKSGKSSYSLRLDVPMPSTIQGTNPTSPCNATECSTVSGASSVACAKIKRSYCANGCGKSSGCSLATDPGCYFDGKMDAIIETTTCEFDDSVQAASPGDNYPCKNFDCFDDALSQKCLQAKVAWCKKADNRISLATNPKCHEQVVTFTGHVKGQCTDLFDGGASMYSSSPCHDLVCITAGSGGTLNSATSKSACQDRVYDYCAHESRTRAKDPACFENLFVPTFGMTTYESSSANQAPHLSTSCTTAETQQSPCFAPACAKDADSEQCHSARNAFCGGFNSKNKVFTPDSTQNTKKIGCNVKLTDLIFDGISAPEEGDVYEVLCDCDKTFAGIGGASAVKGDGIYSSSSKICGAAMFAGIRSSSSSKYYRTLAVGVVAGIEKHRGATKPANTALGWGATDAMSTGSTGKSTLAFTVSPSVGCYGQNLVGESGKGLMHIDVFPFHLSHKRCGQILDATQESSPCLNPICWNLPNGNISDACQEVVTDYCASLDATEDSMKKNKICFRLLQWRGGGEFDDRSTYMHRSNCPFDWDYVPAKESDPVNPCHAHQCFDSGRPVVFDISTPPINTAGVNDVPHDADHASRSKACYDIVKAYCASRPSEPFCQDPKTSYFEPMRLGVQGCEELYFGLAKHGGAPDSADAHTDSLCRSPACNPLAPVVSLLDSSGPPVRYIRITPGSEGSRGTLRFRGLQAPVSNPALVILWQQ